MQIQPTSKERLLGSYRLHSDHEHRRSSTSAGSAATKKNGMTRIAAIPIVQLTPCTRNYPMIENNLRIPDA